MDLIVRKDRAFSRKEFERREAILFEGLEVTIASAEDVILAKLEWGKRGRSERQIEDAAGIVAIRGDELDRDYVAKWAEALEVREQWAEALRKAGMKK